MFQVIMKMFVVSVGLGEGWGHTARGRSLDNNTTRELGSHLLQVIISKMLQVILRFYYLFNYFKCFTSDLNKEILF